MRNGAEIRTRPGASFGVITIGGCDPAVREGLDLLATRGVVADSMRVRGFPFDETVEAFLDEHDFCFVIEQNRDAQLRSLLTLETRVSKARLRSVLVYGGFPLSARHVVDGIMRVLHEMDPSVNGHALPSKALTSETPLPHMQIEE